MKKKTRIERLGIVIKRQPSRWKPILRDLVGWLERHRITPLLEPEAASAIGHGAAGLRREHLAAASDMIVVIGGDGTLLSVARAIGASRTPLLGVNMGSLGFLTEIPLEGLYAAIEGITEGRHEVHSRMRLRAEIIRSGKIAASHELLNDIVVNKSALARILEINVMVDGHFLTTFQADGLIVSTPTGSTAYSLSAGGPIVDPSMDAVVLCPICPHTLTNRPVVTPGGSRVEVSLLDNHGDVYVTIDGQVGAPFLSEDRIRVRKSRHPLRLIHIPDKDYFEVLRKKLKWGGRVSGAEGKKGPGGGSRRGDR